VIGGKGDVVLIWGAAGGLGGYAAQFVRNGGGIAVGVVSSQEKAQAIRKLGCHAVISRGFHVYDSRPGS
jgi:crotonyl-CoA reductase